MAILGFLGNLEVKAQKSICYSDQTWTSEQFVFLKTYTEHRPKMELVIQPRCTHCLKLKQQQKLLRYYGFPLKTSNFV